MVKTSLSPRLRDVLERHGRSAQPRFDRRTRDGRDQRHLATIGLLAAVNDARDRYTITIRGKEELANG